MELQIIKEITPEKPFLIINKPSGIPSAPLTAEDELSENNIFSLAANKFPQLLEVKGRKSIEHGLIHRIDTVTSGLVIIAATQECYEELLELQKQGKIKKYYKATCEILKENPHRLEGFPKFDCFYENEFTIKSYFRAYGPGRKEVRPVTEDSGEAALKKLEKKVLYTSNIKILSKNDNFAKIEVCITNGYRHQVRCHLAWAGLPVAGDSLYNYKEKTGVENLKTSFDFTASKIDISGEIWYI